MVMQQNKTFLSEGATAQKLLPKAILYKNVQLVEDTIFSNFLT